jgi:hypothetical protein
MVPFARKLFSQAELTGRIRQGMRYTSTVRARLTRYRGKLAARPRSTAAIVPVKKTRVATGLRTGFWKRLACSTKGTRISPAGTAAIKVMPRSLFGTTLRIWKVGNRNHSGKISYGVAYGSAASPIIVGSKTAKPITDAIRPKIEIGNMYSRSLGQAGSP